jgi:hypothetical protein
MSTDFEKNQLPKSKSSRAQALREAAESVSVQDKGPKHVQFATVRISRTVDNAVDNALHLCCAHTRRSRTAHFALCE